MHSQLSDKKVLACRELIEALEECHESGWAKFLGACNKHKDELNKCLGSERIARTTKNREKSKEMRTKADKALAEFRAL